VRRRNTSNDQRLTIFLPQGAVVGRVTRFTETGMVACVQGQVPPYERLEFTLHLQGAVIAGEVTSVGQEGDSCRFQFAALTEQDRARLEPFVEPQD